MHGIVTAMCCHQLNDHVIRIIHPDLDTLNVTIKKNHVKLQVILSRRVTSFDLYFNKVIPPAEE